MRNSSKKKAYRWLTQQISHARSWIAASALMGILSGILIIAQARILATVIDHVSLHHATLHSLSRLLWMLLIIIILRSLFVYGKEMSAHHSATNIKSTLRLSLYQTLLSQLPDDIAKYKAGALATTFIEKIEALHGFFADYLPQMMIVVMLPLIILILVFQINSIAGFILLLTAPIVILFMALIGMGVEAINQRQFLSYSRISAHFLDMLQGLTTLSLFNRCYSQIESIRVMSDEYRDKTMRVLRIAFLSSTVLELFATLSIAMLAVYLGLGLLQLIHVGFSPHGISLQQAFFILLLAPEFFMPLRQLGVFYHARAEAIAAASDLMKISKKEIIKTINQQKIILNEKKFMIDFKQVNFTYPNKSKLFSDFSFTISPNECIVITGESGIGKSTLLKLMAKLQYPQAGSIVINNVNLNDIDTDFWRSQIAFLTQHPYLFHDTILNNIQLAKQDATDSEIDDAIDNACINDFLKQLPNGINTIIGEQQMGLSGGQAQRVALARIFLKNTPIILCDEPTVYLDHHAKKIIINAIKKWIGHKTVIIATHDEELITLANRVVSL